MAVQILIHKNSATCWPQIELENDSRLISPPMQNCWALQDCRMHFLSQPHTLGLRTDTRISGLKRTRRPSEITNFSYLVWFTDRPRKVLNFCKPVICVPFPYRMLSDRLVQQETAGERLSVPWVTTALSSHFPAGLTKQKSNASHRLVRNYLLLLLFACFVSDHLVLLPGSKVLGWDKVHPTKCFFNLCHQDTL